MKGLSHTYTCIHQEKVYSFKNILGTSLAVQWLRLHTSDAGGMGLISSAGTKIPHAMWCGQKKINLKNDILIL